VWGDEQVEIINRSRINLGMGGIGYSEELTNVKTRDFEIPGTGGGVYLTSFNPDLALHFEIGREIVCYRNADEMVELIRYYLAHEEEARAIALRGRQRCLAEHRWLHRYQRMAEILGILSPPRLPASKPFHFDRPAAASQRSTTG
jgi:spore maturation protein CgeB